MASRRWKISKGMCVLEGPSRALQGISMPWVLADVIIIMGYVHDKVLLNKKRGFLTIKDIFRYTEKYRSIGDAYCGLRNPTGHCLLNVLFHAWGNLWEDPPQKGHCWVRATKNISEMHGSHLDSEAHCQVWGERLLYAKKKQEKTLIPSKTEHQKVTVLNNKLLLQKEFKSKHGTLLYIP